MATILTPDDQRPTPLALLDEGSDWFERLTDACKGQGLDGLGVDGVVEFLHLFEEFRNRLSLVDHELIGTLEELKVADKYTEPNTPTFVAKALRLARPEAYRRFKAAIALTPQTTMLGEDLPVKRPVLAAAQAEGTLSPEHVAIVVDSLNKLQRNPHITPEQVDAAEETLTQNAREFGPRELRVCADKLADVLDPDGTLADDAAAQSRRNLHLSKKKNGMYRLQGDLTAEVGASLNAVLSPLAKPRPSADGDDLRDAGQRMHDALADVVRRLLQAGDLPASGGTPTSVIVIITEDDLRSRTGYGTTSDDTLIPTSSVIRMANEAEIIPVCFSKSGAILSLGRTRRCADKNQTYALIARDGGCSFPGCDHPPEWCERHHVKAWIDGGLTDVNNLTLLCGYHHKMHLERGWKLIMVNNFPTWIPPKWIDREQKPIIHQRIRERHKINNSGEKLRT